MQKILKQTLTKDMPKPKVTLAVLMILFFSSTIYITRSHAQSPWIGIMPIQYNPSFAGASGSHRFSAMSGMYRLQLISSTPQPNVNTSIYKRQTYGFSYDNFIPKIASGIGISVAYLDRYENTYYNYYDTLGTHFETIKYLTTALLRTSLSISPKISLQGKYTLAPSLELSYKHFYFIADKTTSPLPNDYYEKVNSSFLSLKAGLLFNTPKFYIGYTRFMPLGDSDNRSIFEGDFYTKGAYSQFQAGYHFQRKQESRFSMTLQGYLSTNMVKRYLGGKRLDFEFNLSTNFRYKRVLWGLGLGGAMVGYQTDKIRIVYIHRMFPMKNGYSGELSLRLTLPQKKKVYWNY